MIDYFVIQYMTRSNRGLLDGRSEADSTPCRGHLRATGVRRHPSASMAYDPRHRGDSGDELGRCVVELEASLHELAQALARDVIAAELGRRQRAAGGKPRSTGAVRPARPAGLARPAGPARAMSEREAPATAASAAIAPTGKRPRWTRDAVIAELCEWLISGIVEPAFLRRHGKPGLVTAATRIFGRFDSALNVANLYLAKQYPDGPPAKRGAPIHARITPKRRGADPVPSDGGSREENVATAADAGTDARVDASTASATASIDPVPGDATISRDDQASAPRSH